jgi:ferritin
MDRKLKLLSPTISDLLLKQATHELENYMLYNMFSNFFALEGIVALEKYYYKRAEEEIKHQQWILSYLADGDCKLVYPQTNIENTAKTLIDPFILTINKEIETTQMIYKIADVALAEKDYMTFNWLNQHLIPEQIEEENTSRMARVIMELEADLLEKAEQVLELLEN